MHQRKSDANRLLIVILALVAIVQLTGCSGYAVPKQRAAAASTNTATTSTAVATTAATTVMTTPAATAATTAITTRPTITRTEVDYARGSTFEQAIELSSAAVVAQLVSSNTDRDETIRNVMRISEVLYGDIRETEIDVHQVPGHKPPFCVGIDYLLILNKVDFVTNPGPRYYVVGDCEFLLDQDKKTFTVKYWQKRPIDEPYMKTYATFKEKLLSMKAAQKPGLASGDIQIPYVVSDDLNFIFQHSEAVARVRLQRQLGEPGAYSVLMDCQVLQVYKGSLPMIVWIRFFLGPQVGDEYLVMLNPNHPDQPGTTWSMSSKSSQIAAGSPEFARFRGDRFE